MLNASSACLVLLLQAAPQEPPKKEELEAVVVALKGTVDVKRPEDKDWVPAERNMKLKKGSSICTSVASTASLLFTGNVKLTVKALTEASIEDLAKGGGAMNADVNLKFGAIEVDIQKGDLRTDMKVRSPNSTTSVSGSTGIVRAPASGGGALLSLRTFSGTWTHAPSKLGVEFAVEGAGGVNAAGDLPQDRDYTFRTDQFSDFGGRHPSELYQGRFGQKAGDAHPWDYPFYEFANTGPASKKHRKPAALPLPPGPPGP
jgi:hypothetical protein